MKHAKKKSVLTVMETGIALIIRRDNQGVEPRSGLERQVMKKIPKRQYRVHYQIEGVETFSSKRDAIKFMNNGTPGMRTLNVFCEERGKKHFTSYQIYVHKGKLNI
jgi:hypothetical protein